ncbi:glycosyltransferase family 4 protein [Phenylobacterium sp.]|jgi:glycosyltransferase involved in cell wall biosynthesis|uniref:glycosyltransferase family 4 protein n=1 Tax=Phenylobacterium sp. TaxID=1871053 RepID=UPI002E355B65|nr:glycosyltransferase family 4 protein [Phenylobacterium sp.]HEX3366180.1 glycosyltransferase family 4 protein [Phenylobacterium sp.]
MSLLGAARRLWKSALPAPVRKLAAPALNLALQSYVRRAARAPHGAGGATGPIKIVGYFAGSHGIAASARLAARAFEALQVPVERLDVTDAKLDWDGRLTAPVSAGAWIFHLNPPELLAALACLGPKQLVGPRYGYWAWELPRAPPLWLKDAALVDEVWAPSRYTAEALVGAASPVRVVPHPLFIEDYAAVAPTPRGAAFQGVSVFDFNSSLARKNPQGAIAAWAQAFGGDPACELTLKTQNGGLFPAQLAALRAAAPANVRIVDEVWPYADVQSLIAGADVLVSLHRAEGFGLTPAEAMALGTPVLATAFSGVLDFMDETCALLVPSRPTPVADPQGVYRGQTWADPDIAAAAEALARLRADPALGRRLSAAARERVARQLSPQAWFDTLPVSVQAAARAGRA